MNHFLQGRPQADPTSRIVGANGATPAPGDASPHGNEPSNGSSAVGIPRSSTKGEMRIEPVKEGERVVKIVVTCQCGCRAEIVPEYNVD